MNKKIDSRVYWSGWAQDMKLKGGYGHFFNCWEWEWFCSLPLVLNNYSIAEKKLKVWRRDLAKGEHIQVASMGVYTIVPMPHIHLLAFGKNKLGKTLYDVDTATWEDHWAHLTKRRAVIEEIFDSGGAVHYVSHLNTPPDRSEMLQSYNKHLLNKRKIGSCVSM